MDCILRYLCKIYNGFLYVFINNCLIRLRIVCTWLLQEQAEQAERRSMWGGFPRPARIVPGSRFQGLGPHVDHRLWMGTERIIQNTGL